MSNGKTKNISGRKSHKGDAPPTEQKCGISIFADKKRGVVRMQFEKPILWVDFDALGVANILKHFGDKLRELQS